MACCCWPAMAACLLEILLMYTGYIRHMLHLVDFSEAPASLIGPARYLMVVSLVHGRPGKRSYLHFIFPVVYLLLQMPFLLQPEEAGRLLKDMPHIKVEEIGLQVAIALNQRSIPPLRRSPSARRPNTVINSRPGVAGRVWFFRHRGISIGELKISCCYERPEKDYGTCA